MAKRDLHTASATVIAQPTQDHGGTGDNHGVHKRAGDNPAIPDQSFATSISTSSVRNEPIPAPAVGPVPHDNQHNNPAPSMLTVQNRYILVFCACVLTLFGTYKWLYWDETEDDETQHQNELIADTKNQAL